MGYDCATTFRKKRARRRRLTGAGIEKRHSNKTQQVSEGTMILTPVSALHSRKKGGLKRYEKIRAQRALSDDVSGISGYRDRPAASGNAGHQPSACLRSHQRW